MHFAREMTNPGALLENIHLIIKLYLVLGFVQYGEEAICPLPNVPADKLTPSPTSVSSPGKVTYTCVQPDHVVDYVTNAVSMDATCLDSGTFDKEPPCCKKLYGSSLPSRWRTDLVRPHLEELYDSNMTSCVSMVTNAMPISDMLLVKRIWSGCSSTVNVSVVFTDNFLHHKENIMVFSFNGSSFPEPGNTSPAFGGVCDITGEEVVSGLNKRDFFCDCPTGVCSILIKAMILDEGQKQGADLCEIMFDSNWSQI